MTEIWRDIDGYEGLYQVSNCGRVRSFHKGRSPRILKLRPNHNGYLTVRLCRDNKGKTHRVHRLVAEAFIDNPDDKPEVNHVDGIKTNNHVDNLEWVTAAENIHHADALGLRGCRSPRAKLTDEQVHFIRDNPDKLTGAELAEMFGVTATAVSYVQLGKTYRNAGGRIRTEKPPNPQRVPDDVRAEIRRLYVRGSHEFGSVALAKQFGVDQKTILRIIHET